MSKLKFKMCTESIDQNWSIERIATERPPRTWEKVFKESEYELKDISKTLDKQEELYGIYYPLKKNIFAAFDYTPLSLVKVVIVGQDPYPQSYINEEGFEVPRAQGLSFSVSKDDTIPSSLKNIYKELYDSYRGFMTPDHGDLTSWAKQGVLLLNSCLTLRPGLPKSHDELWLGFIKRICKAIAIKNPNCIYLLWGKEAQNIKTMIGEKSVVLEAAHPSGLSANRGFFKCNHFNKANDILIKQGKEPIDWHIIPPMVFSEDTINNSENK